MENSDIASITGNESLKRVTTIKNIAFSDYYNVVDISEHGTMPDYGFILATVNSTPINGALLICARPEGSHAITLVFDKNPGQINVTLQFSVLK